MRCLCSFFASFSELPKLFTPLQCIHKCSFPFPFLSLRVDLTCNAMGAVTYFCKAGMKDLLPLILLTSNLPRLCRCLKGSGMPRTQAAEELPLIHSISIACHVLKPQNSAAYHIAGSNTTCIVYLENKGFFSWISQRNGCIVVSFCLSVLI